ncbi:MAG: beta-galactosidase [Kiritimatiellae bacterium]|nr:beta-galactosidase [Kiritimatiellia bacterium]
MKLQTVRRVVAVMIVSVASATAGSSRPLLRLSLEVPDTAEPGLVMPSAGDGVHEADVVEGVAVRRLSGGSSRYVYIRVTHPAWTNGPVDAWAVFEVYDDRIAGIALQYDRAPSDAGPADRYAKSPETRWLTGTRQWRRLVFPMPALALRGGQNHRADFRLCAPGIAVRAVELHPSPPPGADAPPPVLPRAVRPPGMELTFGNDAGRDDAAVYRALSVSSVESYVDWAGVEPSPGRWTWSRWDAQLATLEASGLRWVPFLIAGPAYATPLWFQQSSASRFYRCLEHQRESRVQSLFNPHLPDQIERFIAAFAQRYRSRGTLESLLLGITGIYGESIYPAGPEGGWTARLTGPYHNHTGWWAADEDAVAAFRAAMRARYREIAALNHAWGTALDSFEQVTTFLPDRAPSDRARADFVEWYQQAMTDWCVRWAEIVRRHFPDLPVYLCTGGGGDPVLGADFTAQAKAMARLGIGIRITNESGDYAQDFTLTREVATATRAYRTFCGFEPAGNVSATGNVARIYNATASGARQLHAYADNIVADATAMELFRRWVPMLAPRTPRTELALYLPRETWALDPAANERLRAIARELRDVADHDHLTRLTVSDGHLRGYSALLVAEAEVIEPAVADEIERWVRDGGLLLVATRTGRPPGSRLYDLAQWRARMLVQFTGAPPRFVEPRLEGPVPDQWRLDIGSGSDSPWLEGDWHGPERRGEGTCRWTGRRAVVRVPSEPGTPGRGAIELHVPAPALKEGPVEVLVDGRRVAAVNQPGLRVVDFEVSAPIARGRLAELELRCSVWRPSEVSGSSDTRQLGVEVRQVVWRRLAGGGTPASAVSVVREVSDEAVAAATRGVGRGRTVHLEGLAARPRELAQVVAHMLPDLPDRRLDGRYATRTTDGVLWLDPSLPRIWLERDGETGR